MNNAKNYTKQYLKEDKGGVILRNYVSIMQKILRMN